MDVLSMVPAEDFKAKCGAEHANYGINQGGDNGNLNTSRPRKPRKASVVVDVNFAAFWNGSFRGV